MSLAYTTMLVAVGGGGGAEEELKRSQLMLPVVPDGPNPSITTFTIWGPAASETEVDIVAHVCHPPVLGNVKVPVLLTPPTSTWNVPPLPMLATRTSSA